MKHLLNTNDIAVVHTLQRRLLSDHRLGHVLLGIGLMIMWLLPSSQQARPAAAQAITIPGAKTRILLETPTWTGFYPPAWVTATPVTTGITARSDAGISPAGAAYRVSFNGGISWTAWGADGLAVTVLSSSIVQLKVTALALPDSATQNRIQFKVNTAAGQEEQSSVYNIQVDTTAPGIPTGMASTPSSWTNVNNFRESWTNPLDTSGIVGAYYKLNEEPQFPTDGIYITTTNTLNNIQVPGEGAHTVLVWLKDAAGNVDHNNYRVHLNAFRYDATVPNVVVTNATLPGSNGWYTSTVTLGFTPADSASGIQSWGWQLDGGALNTATTTQVTASGVHTITINAADRAGNTMPVINYPLPIDTELPLLGYRLSDVPAVSGWYTTPLTVTLAMTDLVSGPDKILYQLNGASPLTGAVIALAADGFHRITTYGKDKAGNRSAVRQLNLPVDSHAPTTTLLAAPAQPQSTGYYTRPVTVQLSASDIVGSSPPMPGSGVQVTRLRVNNGSWQNATPQYFQTSGIYRLNYYSADVAGNVEISRTRVISLDLDLPAAPIAPVIAPTTWSPQNAFSLTWQNPADLSGIASIDVWIGSDNVNPSAAVSYPATGQITGLQAPGQGEWPVWVALRDGAGNRSAFVRAGVLRYDADPPTLQSNVTGTPGKAGWYIGAAQVTLSLTDAGSGPLLLRYRLNQGAWQQTTGTATFALNNSARYVIEYYGEDHAGFVAGPLTLNVNVDREAPSAPTSPTISPAAWSNVNDWTLTWLNPSDVSGADLLHWSFTAPANASAGTTAPASAQTLRLQAPGEGSHTLYLWLEDVAGNKSLASLVTLADALRYDVTLPTLNVQFSPTQPASGWFRTSVQATVSASDSVSGVAGTVSLLDGQPVPNDSSFSISGDGTHTIFVRVTDRAGNNLERTHTVRIDGQAPAVQLTPLPRQTDATQIPVQWAGDDKIDGSGIVGYDVQVKQGTNGTWQPWLTGTTATSGTFNAQRSQLYSFRMRATDLAGNVSDWALAGGRNTVFVDPVANGTFGTMNFTRWNTTTTLDLSLIAEQDLIPGQIIPAARLGSTAWSACALPGNIPTLTCGDSWSGISQQITLPSLADVPNPKLEFWYRLQSYDQITTTASIWNTLCPVTPTPPFRWADTFDVTIQPAGAAQATVLLRTGVSREFAIPVALVDLKWQRAEIDLSAYAGQTVTLEFSNHNRLDSRFNTWTDIYGLRIRGAVNQLFFPLVANTIPNEVEEPVYCSPATPAATDTMSSLPAPLPLPLPEDDVR